MDFFTALKTGAQGLSVQRTRINLTSSNLANVETTAADGELGYRRKTAIIQAIPVTEAFDEVLGDEMHRLTHGAEVVEIQEEGDQGRLEYAPDHPHANEEGYIRKPDISVIDEMVDMITASRAYEANVTVVQSVKKMAQQALEIGS